MRGKNVWHRSYYKPGQGHQTVETLPLLTDRAVYATGY